MNFLFGTAFADPPTVTPSAPASSGTASGTSQPASHGEAGVGSAFMSFLPIVLMIVVFYFLLIRPQQKRMKQHRETLSKIRRGDRVLTSGGIIGTVSKIIDDNEVLIEISENVKVRVLKSTIADVIAKTEPVKESSTPKENSN